MKKRGLVLGLILIGVLFISLSFVSASYQLSSSSIDSSYGPYALVTGNMNISFNSENYNALIRAVIGSDSYQMTLKDYLFKNGLSPVSGYSCSTSQCDMAYFAIGNGTSTKSLNLNSVNSTIVGFNLTGSFDSVLGNGFNLTISSNVPEGCSAPLKIDILDDGVYEWIANSATSDFCQSNYGCYIASPTNDYRTLTLNTKYCNKVSLSSFPKINVGASINVTGTASSTFVMSIRGDSVASDTCSFTASISGDYSCDINVSSLATSDIEVCISNTAGSQDYQISRKVSQANCGYVNDASTDTNVSFAIFARPYEYAQIPSFSLTSASSYLAMNLENYISNTGDKSLSAVYSDKDCSKGCVLPIKFVSSQSQVVTLSEPKLIYRLSSTDSNTVTTLFDLIKQPSLITTNSKVLDISKFGAIVPGNGTNAAFDLYLGSTKILSKNISILDVPVIDYISTQRAPAGIRTFFFVKTSGQNITKYTWNFGDNTSIQETIIPEVYHTYSSLGTYNLKVSASNSFGNSSKTFAIQVVSPGEYIPLMINYTNGKINYLTSLLASFPQFVNDYFKNKLGLNNLQTQVSSFSAQYTNAGGSATVYTSIASALSNISIPDSVKSIELQSIKFLINKAIINVADVESATGEKRETGTDEEYKERLYSWNFNYLDISIDEEVYGIFYGDTLDSSATRLNVKVSPKDTVEDAYMIINAKKSDIVFKDNTIASQAKDLGASTGIPLGSLTARKEVEFLVSGRFNVLDSPVYFATKLSLLPKEFNPTGCNYNQICEAGENSGNCRNDCRPVGLTLMWLALLLLGFLAAYIALQEWYKRNYESYLFKNKNDLFNLIHFIDNAEKQKLTRADMYKKLEEKGWNHEQIEYAYKKYKGLRTGMWEIPIFKFIENRQVNSELLKRKNLGVNPQITPRPIRTFNPAEKRPFMVPKAPIQKPLIPQIGSPIPNSASNPPKIPAKANQPKPETKSTSIPEQKKP